MRNLTYELASEIHMDIVTNGNMLEILNKNKYKDFKRNKFFIYLTYTKKQNNWRDYPRTFAFVLIIYEKFKSKIRNIEPTLKHAVIASLLIKKHHSTKKLYI